MDGFKRALAKIGMVSVSLTLSLTMLAILFSDQRLENLFRLLELILSWPVVAGGLVFGGGQAIAKAVAENWSRPGPKT